jgi:citrate lyase subunit beta/citryl-CoA lyase
MYVPANVPRFVAKAAAAGADAIILDLEDSVPPAEKAVARDALAPAVPAIQAAGADVTVRINRPLRLAVADIAASVAAGADALLITKVMGPEHVRLVAGLLEELEAERGPGRTTRLLPVIEGPEAALCMPAIAAAHPRVCGMLVGAEDLATETGAAADDALIVLVKRQMVLATRAAGVAAFGTLGTVANFRDPDAVRDVAAQARRSGFTGATCIHPALVPVLNDAFSPSAAELDLARRQIAANETAMAEGRGSFTVDGRMVDEPVIRRARRLLAQAERRAR